MTTTDPVGLPRFTQIEAWTLGSGLAEQCLKAALPVTISITLGAQRVFHAALPGTSADNDAWVARKMETVRRFDLSSALVDERIAQQTPDFHRVFALPEDRYAAAGGAVPLRVGGAQVGVLAISGLTSQDDHRMAVEAVAALAETLTGA